MTWEFDDSKKVHEKITSAAECDDLKETVNELVDNELWTEIPVEFPDFVSRSAWYSSKWYVSNKTGCLWDITYPDFPALGTVRSFPNGVYENYHGKKYSLKLGKYRIYRYYKKIRYFYLKRIDGI